VGRTDSEKGEPIGQQTSQAIVPTIPHEGDLR
jgi:hypothetical protein